MIIQAFWLGALGLLFLGNWPGGRGPAWETGEAVPWPSPQQRRGQVEAGDEARRRGRQRGRRQRRGAGRARVGARVRARATQLPEAQAQALRRAALAALAAAALLPVTPAAAQPAPALELRAPRVVATGAAVDLRGAGAQPRERVRFEIRLRGGRWARLAATRADAARPLSGQGAPAPGAAAARAAGTRRAGRFAAAPRANARRDARRRG